MKIYALQFDSRWKDKESNFALVSSLLNERIVSENSLIVLPEMLYERIEEVTERVDANDNIIVPLDLDDLEPRLRLAYAEGIRAIAIVLMHGYRVTTHEEKIAALAKTIGFTQISTSHATSPMIKFVGRGDTTVADAYLSPILRRYVDRLATDLDGSAQTKFQLMQSMVG